MISSVLFPRFFAPQQNQNSYQLLPPSKIKIPISSYQLSASYQPISILFGCREKDISKLL